MLPTADLWGSSPIREISRREALIETLYHAALQLGELRLTHDLVVGADSDRQLPKDGDRSNWQGDQVKDAAVTCTVRTAGPEDLPAVLGVHARRDHGGDVPSSASDLEVQTWMLMMRSESLTVYLAEVDGQVVGTATLIATPNLTCGCAPTAFVEAVAVAAGHRRKGIATAIMRRLLRDARSAGCNKVQLLSHKRHASDGAHRLYTSLGFEPEAEGFCYISNRFPLQFKQLNASEAPRLVNEPGDGM